MDCIHGTPFDRECASCDQSQRAAAKERDKFQPCPDGVRELVLYATNDAQLHRRMIDDVKSAPTLSAQRFAATAAHASWKYQREFGSSGEGGRIFSTPTILAAAAELACDYARKVVEGVS